MKRDVVEARVFLSFPIGRLLNPQTPLLQLDSKKIFTLCVQLNGG
jgi:hypothetical protein